MEQHITNSEKEILGMIEIYADSVNNLDMELIKTLWGEELDPSFVHPRGDHSGLKSIIDGFYMGTMGLFSTRELRPKDIKISINGESALAFFYWDFVAYFKEDGSRHETHGRETQYYVKFEGKWKLVHVHYSGLPVTGDREGF